MSYVRDRWTWLRIKHQNRAYRALSEGYALPGGYERIYCFHVRKTGGTSLHRSFMALGGEDAADVHERLARSAGNRTISGGLAFVAHSSQALEDGWYFYGWSHFPAHELRLPARTFSMSILRDPVERVCSHYQMLLYGTEGAYPFPHAEEEAGLARGGFDHFMANVAREDLLRQLFMFSSSFDVDEAAERLLACEHLLFTESYASDLARLGERLGLRLAMRRERVSARRFELSARDRTLLERALEPEYELLARLSERRRV